MLGNYQETESRLKVLFMAIAHNPRHLVGQLTLAVKLISRRIHRLPVGIRFALILSLLLVVVYWIIGNRLTSDSFLEVGKCPACFGFTICSAARSGDVWFTGWSKIRLLDYFNVDNVYTGVFLFGNGDHIALQIGWKYLLFQCN